MKRSPLLISMLLAFGAQHAQPSHAADAVVPLLPIKDPCGSCDQPIAQAGSPGSAGNPNSQSLPVAPTPTVNAFRVNDLRLNGAQTLSSDELKSVTQPYIGRDVTLGDLEALAQAITAQYRARGYFLATAIVPVQTVRDGIVEISIIEGRLGKVEVNVAADAPMSEARVRGFLSELAVGEAVNAPVYERSMLLLSDQPGIRVSSGLQEGTQTGTTDLSVDVVAVPRWAFSAEADNHGTLESGRYRVGGTARWLSPFGIGDNLDMRVMVSNSTALQFGRLAYEAPIGTGGLRAGIGLSRVAYALGGNFVDLDARGTANVLDFALNYPLIRQRQQNLFLRLTADTKNLTDEMRAVAFTSKKKVHGFGLGWTWERRDDVLGGGYWASSGTLYHGTLHIEDEVSLQHDAGIAGRHTEGAFSKGTFQLSRLQSIVDRHSLYLSVGGQAASKNLDASEKLSLGGARAVRAYSSSEALVDQGLIGIVEWRWSYNAELSPFAFYDAARGKYARSPSAFDGPNNISLRGYGLGVSWARSGNFAINATLAWREGTRPAQSDGGGHNPRFYIQAQKSF